MDFLALRRKSSLLFPNLLHDRRLKGTPPAIAENTYQVGASTATTGMIRWVATYAQRQRVLDELIIMCHGFNNPNAFDGLQISGDNLTIANLARTVSWTQKMRNIIIYACGAANPGTMGPAHSGQVFSSVLAGTTGATVFAADENQLYLPISPTGFFNRQYRIDFGAWEGQVYKFTPSGSIAPVSLGLQPTSR